jgi:hypothetical protein
MWARILPFGGPALLEESSGSEGYVGSWSPQGDRLAFLQIADNQLNLAIIKVGLETSISRIASDIDNLLPDWSPTGEWIIYATRNGWKMLSPDGRKTRSLGKINTQHLAFSKNGKLLYGIRFDQNRQHLFLLNWGTLQMKTLQELRREDWPQSGFAPSIRLSLAPDGNSAIYSAAVVKSNIWLLEGSERQSLLRYIGLR